MADNAKAIEAVKASIDAINSNTTVSKEQTKSDLEEIREHIDDLVAAL